MLSHFSHVQLLVILWTVACQTFQSMGFSRQEYWSGLLCLPPGDLLNPRTEPVSHVSCISRWILYHWGTWEAHVSFIKWKKVKLLSRVRLFATPWTVARQVPLSMGFSRQEYWSGLLCPSPGDPPVPGIEPRSFALQADSLPSELSGKPYC